MFIPLTPVPALSASITLLKMDDPFFDLPKNEKSEVVVPLEMALSLYLTIAWDVALRRCK